MIHGRWVALLAVLFLYLGCSNDDSSVSTRTSPDTPETPNTSNEPTDAEIFDDAMGLQGYEKMFFFDKTRNVPDQLQLGYSDYEVE
jgi:hypothetical protein